MGERELLLEHLKQMSLHGEYTSIQDTARAIYGSADYPDFEERATAFLRQVARGDYCTHRACEETTAALLVLQQLNQMCT